MSAEPSEAPPEDDAAGVARLSKELEEAEAALQRVTAENAELKRALGEPPGAPRAARSAPRRPQGGYRGPDARAALEAAIAEVNGAVASIDIDNAMMRSRADEKGAARDGAKRWRTIGRILLAMVALTTALAVWQSPRGGGPMMLLFVAIGTGVYTLYGWVLVFSSLGRARVARALLSRKPTPIAGAPAGQPIVVRGTVVGREAAFDAWFPDGERAVWQDVNVFYVGGRRREHLAHRHREAAVFPIADAAGDRLRVEPAGADIVPEEVSCYGSKLSRPGRRELDAIGGIVGERDEMTIEIALVRLGATVLVEGQVSNDPEPTLRATRGAPLRMVVLDAEGGVPATRAFDNGLRIGVVYAGIAIAAWFAFLALAK